MMIVCMLLCSCEFQLPESNKESVNLISIGLSYEGTNANSLGGTINDAAEIFQAFELLYGDSIVCSSLLTDKQATKDTVKETIRSLPEAELTILFYSGHGWTDGSLVLSADPVFLPPAELNPACLMPVEELLGLLRELSGRKLLIIDACYSGAFVQDCGGSVSLVGEEEPFRAVCERYFSSFPNQNSLFVLSCTTADNTGKESRVWSHKHGYFTKALLDAMGWDHEGALKQRIGKLTLDGLYLTIKKTQSIALEGSRGQHPMVFQGADNLVLYQANGNW